MELPYQEVYAAVDEVGRRERRTKGRREPSSARTGVYKATTRRIIASYGWQFKATMGIGTGCRVHLRPDELPSGRIICRLSKHIVAAIDGEIHDTHDCTRDGTRCVYGYFYKPKAT